LVLVVHLLVQEVLLHTTDQVLYLTRSLLQVVVAVQARTPMETMVHLVVVEAVKVALATGAVELALLVRVMQVVSGAVVHQPTTEVAVVVVLVLLVLMVLAAQVATVALVFNQASLVLPHIVLAVVVQVSTTTVVLVALVVLVAVETDLALLAVQVETAQRTLVAVVVAVFVGTQSITQTQQQVVRAVLV
jgi:hypothetical protein